MRIKFKFETEAGPVEVEGYAGDGEQEILSVTLGGRDHYRQLTTQEAEDILSRIAELAEEEREAEEYSRAWDRGYDRTELLAAEVAR